MGSAFMLMYGHMSILHPLFLLDQTVKIVTNVKQTLEILTKIKDFESINQYVADKKIKSEIF